MLCSIDNLTRKNKQGASCPPRAFESRLTLRTELSRSRRREPLNRAKCYPHLEEILIGYKKRFCVFRVEETKPLRKGSNKSSEVGQYHLISTWCLQIEKRFSPFFFFFSLRRCCAQTTDGWSLLCLPTQEEHVTRSTALTCPLPSPGCGCSPEPQQEKHCVSGQAEFTSSPRCQAFVFQCYLPRLLV